MLAANPARCWNITRALFCCVAAAAPDDEEGTSRDSWSKEEKEGTRASSIIMQKVIY
jgi:hypothetical protein